MQNAFLLRAPCFFSTPAAATTALGDRGMRPQRPAAAGASSASIHYARCSDPHEQQGGPSTSTSTSTTSLFSYVPVCVSPGPRRERTPGFFFFFASPGPGSASCLANAHGAMRPWFARRALPGAPCTYGRRPAAPRGLVGCSVSWLLADTGEGEGGIVWRCLVSGKRAKSTRANSRAPMSV